MQTVTSTDGTTIAFDQLGAGTPLVLVAGASCDRATDTAIAEALATHFTVLNYDRRGRGDSTDTPPYAVDREIEDLEVLIASAGGSATLAGLSSGGALAAHAAASGLSVSHLVMWEPPFRLDADGQRASKEYAAQLNALLAQNRRGDALALFMSMVGLPDEVIAKVRQSPYWALGEAMAPTLAYDAAVMGDGAVPRGAVRRHPVPHARARGRGEPGLVPRVGAGRCSRHPRSVPRRAARADPGRRSRCACLRGQSLRRRLG